VACPIHCLCFAAGCGEGRLLEHLLSNCTFTPMRLLVGLDTSSRALQAASRRLSNLIASTPFSEVPVPSDAGASPMVMEGRAQGISGDARGAGEDLEESGVGRVQSIQFSSLAISQGPQPTVIGRNAVFDSAGDASTAHALVGAALAQERWATNLPVPRAVCGTAAAAVKDGSLALEASQGSFAVAATASPTPDGPHPVLKPVPSLGDASMVSGEASMAPAEANPVWRAQLELVQGSLVAPALVGSAGWGQLRGRCDLACMVEVIEHLQPNDVALVAPVLLGGLRPRAAVVTTPNWEYNK